MSNLFQASNVISQINHIEMCPKQVCGDLIIDLPLVQVVMAVAQMYHHIAPHNEMGIVAKPLIRLLRSHSEIQNIVLSNIATMSAERPVSWS